MNRGRVGTTVDDRDHEDRLHLRRVLVSFDIDGTMEFGDPPGPILTSVVRALVERGHIVGSASDRVMSSQERLWQGHGLDLGFFGGKHQLADVRERFFADRYLHFGDTDVDKHYASLAGFEYFSVHDGIDPVLSELAL